MKPCQPASFRDDFRKTILLFDEREKERGKKEKKRRKSHSVIENMIWNATVFM